LRRWRKDVFMSIGQRIAERRKELGLTADEVSAFIGVNRATLYKYESSQIKNMGVDKIKLLAGVLKTTPEYLMGPSPGHNPAGSETRSGDELYMYLKKKLGYEPDAKYLRIFESLVDSLIKVLEDQAK